jgi:hypothetical protein
LKIYDKLFTIIPLPEIGDAVSYLLLDGKCRLAGTRPETIVIAIDAPGNAKGSVPVRTGETSIHINFMNRRAESLLYKSAE